MHKLYILHTRTNKGAVNTFVQGAEQEGRGVDSGWKIF